MMAPFAYITSQVPGGSLPGAYNWTCGRGGKQNTSEPVHINTGGSKLAAPLPRLEAQTLSNA